MTNAKITVVLPVSEATAALSLLQELSPTELNYTTLEDDRPTRPPKRRKSGPRERKSWDVLYEAHGSKPFTKDQANRALISAGYRATTVHPTLSRLRLAGFLREHRGNNGEEIFTFVKPIAPNTSYADLVRNRG